MLSVSDNFFSFSLSLTNPKQTDLEDMTKDYNLNK